MCTKMMGVPFLTKHTSLWHEFVLARRVILWVREPFVGEKLPNVWRLFFIEIADCASVPVFIMH
jgi:hypothetical protein